jgi:hypothetical protein
MPFISRQGLCSSWIPTCTFLLTAVPPSAAAVPDTAVQHGPRPPSVQQDVLQWPGCPTLPWNDDYNGPHTSKTSRHYARQAGDPDFQKKDGGWVRYFAFPVANLIHTTFAVEMDEEQQDVNNSTNSFTSSEETAQHPSSPSQPQPNGAHHAIRPRLRI